MSEVIELGSRSKRDGGEPPKPPVNGNTVQVLTDLLAMALEGDLQGIALVGDLADGTTLRAVSTKRQTLLLGAMTILQSAVAGKLV